ncbi:hypothetical protein [Flammeovirga aprica]|uniref:Protein BatD n=1 Tax=Flammeovirga aprica JL-4 TaxID=694437 RepID=A0A7X9RX61_9BACT|nr:hypothetical protein [Flammeovirga aprica]NME70381.1 hypothetical protein [Flammeovirga aprica JL-4]
MKYFYLSLVFVFLLSLGKVNAQVFKFEKPAKSEKITTKLLSNGNKNSRWKQVIFTEAKPSKSNSLITDALMVDFGVIDNQSKEINLFCTGGFSDAEIEVFYVGDTDFFSIDIDTTQNVWQKFHETKFTKRPLKDLKVKIRAKSLEKGQHKSFLAFRIDQQLYRVALKSNTKKAIPSDREDVNLNLGLVEADSTGFTDFSFTTLGELPLEIEYTGDTSAFIFMIEGDTIHSSTKQTIVPSSDSLVLSFLPIATVLGDKYGELILKNNYVEQHVFITSRVSKIRGEVFWKDTTTVLTKNISFEKEKLYSPLDTIWLNASFYNDSDYDTLFTIDSLIDIQLPPSLKYQWNAKNIQPRSADAIQIPLTLVKSYDLSKDLEGEITVTVKEDSSSTSHKFEYKPFEKLMKEVQNNIPEKLQFTSHKDTFEIKVPFLNTGKNAVYPSPKTFINELQLPKGIQMYYGTPRVRPWQKGYVSIYLTPYDSINFHKTKVDTLSLNIYGTNTTTSIELIQQPWTEILKDYLMEIVLGIALIILIVLGILSPRIIKLLKSKYADYKKEVALKHKKELYQEMEDLMKESSLEDVSFKEGLTFLKKELDKNE